MNEFCQQIFAAARTGSNGPRNEERPIRKGISEATRYLLIRICREAASRGSTDGFPLAFDHELRIRCYQPGKSYDIEGEASKLQRAGQ